MIQRYMLSILEYHIRSKVKRLIKRGITQETILLERVTQSVNKHEVQAMILGTGLEPLVVESYAREIIVDELNKTITKHWWSVLFGKTKQTA